MENWSTDEMFGSGSAANAWNSKINKQNNNKKKANKKYAIIEMSVRCGYTYTTWACNMYIFFFFKLLFEFHVLLAAGAAATFDCATVAAVRFNVR